MVNLLLQPDSHILTSKGVITTVCDPACGNGGMLAEAQNWIREHNPDARVLVFGQDYNPRSYAVAASDLLIKGHRDGRVEFGNSLTDDKFNNEKFDYLLANPPFGVDWKAEQTEISKWSDFHGYTGKLPRVNDGALLFLLAMIGKFQPVDSELRRSYGDRYSSVMRRLWYSINVTLYGCCDHRAMLADEDLHRHAVENLDQADALLFGRVTYEMMEAAFRPPT